MDVVVYIQRSSCISWRYGVRLPCPCLGYARMLYLLALARAEARRFEVLCWSIHTRCMLQIPAAGKTGGGTAVELQVKYRNSIRADTANVMSASRSTEARVYR